MTTTDAAGAVADFVRDTAIVALGPGRYGATISPGWSAAPGPNGGYVAAIVLRALQAAVADPARAPRSLTLHYLRSPATAPCEIVVTVQRTGRSLTSVSARLEQDGATMALALAAFSVPFGSVADYATPPPAVAPPSEHFVVSEDARLPPMARRCRMETRFGPRPLSGGDEALTGGWLRLADPAPVDAAVLSFYTDAWLPAPFTRITAFAPAPTVDLTIHFRTTLAPGALDPEAAVLVRFASRTSAEGFFEEDGQIWAPDGTLLAQSRQLAILMPGRHGG